MSAPIASIDPISSIRLSSSEHILPRIPLAPVLISMSLLMSACRSRAPEIPQPAVAGEPERYSAVIVRFLERQPDRFLEETRFMRSGEKIRQEWVEGDETVALIARPDQGKIFLMSLQRQVYEELEISELGSLEPSAPRASLIQPQSFQVEPERIERSFEDALPASSVKTRPLPDQVVHDHRCSVEERTAVYADERVEVIRTYRARDLEGLPIRVENESRTPSGTIMVVTERRQIELDAPDHLFEVPPHFRKVAKLSDR